MEHLISIIVPAFNEEESIPVFYEAIKHVFSDDINNYQYELIFVDDGSKDKTLELVKDISLRDMNTHYISFSRNFGKEAAILAGLKNATGEFTAIMDADMQDPPSILPEMIGILEGNEYDSVATRRKNRNGEPPIRSFFAKQFYSIINKISDADIVDGARDFRLMKRKMVDAILKLGEYNRFSKGIFGWVGFKTYWLEYENVERVAGTTKWNFWKLFLYAIDGIVDFSQVPLSLASWFGILSTALSFFGLLFVVIRKLLFGDPVSGWASLVCIILFIGGIQLFCMEIIGQYLAKVYLETKNRPVYLVRESDIEYVKE